MQSKNDIGKVFTGTAGTLGSLQCIATMADLKL